MKKKFIEYYIKNKKMTLEYDTNLFKRNENLAAFCLLKHLNANIDLYKEQGLHFNQEFNSDLLISLRSDNKTVILNTKPLSFDSNQVTKDNIIRKCRYKIKPTKDARKINKEDMVIMGVYPKGDEDIYMITASEPVCEFIKVKSNDSSIWILHEMMDELVNSPDLWKYYYLEERKRYKRILLFKERVLPVVLKLICEGQLEFVNLHGEELKDVLPLRQEELHYDIKLNEFEQKLVNDTLEKNIADAIFSEQTKSVNKKRRSAVAQKYKAKRNEENIYLEISDDQSFEIDETSHALYAEVHHIVPFRFVTAYPDIIDVEDNLVLLSANAHEAVHKGTEKVKKEVMTRIIQSKKDSMENTRNTDQTVQFSDSGEVKVSKVVQWILTNFYS